MRGKRQAFSREFKLEAVRLMEEGSKPPAELARELGAFPGSGGRPASGTAADETRRLRHELAKAKEGNEILKKAAAFFARELK